MNQEHINALGQPDLQIEHFKLWVYGINEDEPPDQWLRCVATCEKPDSRVTVSGEIIMLSELLSFRSELKQLSEPPNGVAELGGAEPYLLVALRYENGRGECRIEITPNHLQKEHVFRIPVDQSYVTMLRRQLALLSHRLPSSKRSV